ncbi:MAG: hypothetical protein ACRC3Y_07240 [Romboutsia sp.]|uniref:hypothetical protein n=1 Tax=Romboutsia sp. TaxID=1965302 RepID=UPI003F33C31A
MRNRAVNIILILAFISILIISFYKFAQRLNVMFEDEYDDYNKETNMYLNENEEFSREQTWFYNTYVGMNIKDVKDEGLEKLDTEEKGLEVFESISGYKVIMSYDENGIITNVNIKELHN